MSRTNRQKRARNKQTKSVYVEDRTVVLLMSALEAAKSGDEYSKEVTTMAAIGNEARARYYKMERAGVDIGKLQADLEWLTAGIVAGRIKPRIPISEQVTAAGELIEPPTMQGAEVKALAEEWGAPLSAVMEEVNEIVKAGGELSKETVAARLKVRAGLDMADVRTD